MPRTSANEQSQRPNGLLAAALYYYQMITTAVALYATRWYWKQPYHTSALTGAAWVRELIYGHPERIRSELGMHLHVFLGLVGELRACGLGDSRYISLNEQLAIFLYTCVTGLSTRHVGERFQHANGTISKYFRGILTTLASPAFYNRHVSLPTTDSPVPPEIANNPKWFPFFEGAIGAMDGTHIAACPSAEERHALRNRKGGVSQNCLACCSFDFRFQYMLSGWEGSAADASVFHDARTTDLPVPEGRYYLADAGFGACDALLVPYRGVRYHLAEWGRAGVRPQNREELYNLRHASARNVIERIFGVLKERFTILTRPPEYDMHIQAMIPPALAAIQNYILNHDSEEVSALPDLLDPVPGALPLTDQDFGVLARGPARTAEKARAATFRDQVAQEMWESYQELIAEREELALED